MWQRSMSACWATPTGPRHVRTELSRKMHIRKAPRLIFVEDDGAAYAAHINELLKELNVDSGEPAAETDGE